MVTASPSANGSAGARTPPARDQLRAARAENALRVERIRAARLAQVEAREDRRRKLTESLSVDWVTPYAELLDLTRRSGDPVLSGPTSAWQRRGGKNWPVYQTEADLNLLRAPARVLLATNGYAQGLVEGLTSYVLGPGCTYRVVKAGDRDDLPDDAVDALQDVVDEILARNQWYGGEQPGVEEELFGRSVEDGEFLLVHYPREDGWCDFRVPEPEQLTCPPGADPAEWAFGVRTPADDAQRVLGYYLQFGDSPDRGEEYAPDEVTHFRRNVRRSMKRGVTDFCFDTYDALSLAGRLRTNLGDTAAQQASIVAVRQHESGTAEDVQAFVDADADLTQSVPLTGGSESVKVRRRGSWEDIPKGMSYVAGPIATSTPIHLQVLDACLRGAGQKWQAPPWLMSGDLNAMNYATSLTAESPFVRTVLRRQRGYCEAFRRPVWFALEHYVRVRGLRDRTGRVWAWEELEGRIKLQVTAPSPETRDKLAEAQRAQVEIPLGVQSRQAYMQEQGRDVDQVEADNQAYQDKFGGDGQPLPDQPGRDGGGAGAPTPGGDGGQPGELRGTVGGLQAITSIQQQFYAGQIPQAAAIASLVTLFGFSDEEARGMFPPVEPVKRTDDGQGGGDLGSGGDPMALPESLLEDEAVSDIVVSLLEADAPPGKVWKTITYTRGGKQVTQKRLVNAEVAKKGKAGAKKDDDTEADRVAWDKVGGKAGAAAKQPAKKAAAKKPDPAKAVAAVKAQLAGDPAKLTPAKVRDLGEKLKGLTVAQIREIKAAHDLKGGKTKAEHVAGLVEKAKALKAKADADKKAAKAGAEKQPEKQPDDDIFTLDAGDTPAHHKTRAEFAAAMDKAAGGAKAVATLSAAVESAKAKWDSAVRAHAAAIAAYKADPTAAADKAGSAATAALNEAARKYRAANDAKLAARGKQVAAAEAILAASSADGGEVKAHGMADPEKTRHVVLDGVALHYPDTPEGRRQAAETLAAVAGAGLPPALWGATGRVVLSAQRNKDDGYWEKKYNTPGFKAAATGGDGGIVVYNGGPAGVHVFAHEGGHNLATKTWGSTNPDPKSEYGKAHAKEPAVTEYGKHNSGEDFAEAVALYTSGGRARADLAAKFPLKYAAVHKLLGGT